MKKLFAATSVSSLITLYFCASAMAGYDCEISLLKTSAPSIVLGSVRTSQPTGETSTANWGRLYLEKSKKSADGARSETAIEIGGWVDATARFEGAKFSIYRNTYVRGELQKDEFVRPIQIDGTYDRTATFENYTVHVNCSVK